MKQTTNTMRRLMRAAITALAFCLAVAVLPGCTPAATSQGSVGSDAAQSAASSTGSSDAGASVGTSQAPQSSDEQAKRSASSTASERAQAEIDEDGSYTSKDEVALYIHTYGHLPSNFISKSAAKKKGWVSSKGNLDEVCPGMSIGGSQFYNDEGQLPDKKGRTWKECDIGYEGGFRGAERIVFSNDGLIYYTADHYKTFEQLY